MRRCLLSRPPLGAEKMEVWSAAIRLVREMGHRAPVVVAMRANDLLEKRDYAGYFRWRRVFHAVKQLNSLRKTGRV